jgi:hypothetical protein
MDDLGLDTDRAPRIFRTIAQPEALLAYDFRASFVVDPLALDDSNVECVWVGDPKRPTSGPPTRGSTGSVRRPGGPSRTCGEDPDSPWADGTPDMPLPHAADA